MTTSVVYDGPHPEFVIDELDQTLVLQAGVPFDVPDGLAARLIEQSTYSLARNETPEQKAARDKREQDEAAAAAAVQAAAEAEAKVAADQAAATDTTKGTS